MSDKKGRGRPAYKPSPTDSHQVRIMAASGLSHDTIALCLGNEGIDPKTLRKHFARELAVGADLAHTAVATRAFTMALRSENPAWAIFWLKCRAGWKEKHEIQHTGKDGEKLLTLADLDRIVQGPEE